MNNLELITQGLKEISNDLNKRLKDIRGLIRVRLYSAEDDAIIGDYQALCHTHLFKNAFSDEIKHFTLEHPHLHVIFEIMECDGFQEKYYICIAGKWTEFLDAEYTKFNGNTMAGFDKKVQWMDANWVVRNQFRAEIDRFGGKETTYSWIILAKQVSDRMAAEAAIQREGLNGPRCYGPTPINPMLR